MRRAKYITVRMIDDLYLVRHGKKMDSFEDLDEARDHARTLSIRSGEEVQDKLADHAENHHDDQKGLFTTFIGDQEIWMAFCGDAYRCFLTPFDALWSTD